MTLRERLRALLRHKPQRSPYVIGERRPELFIPTTGPIRPRVPGISAAVSPFRRFHLDREVDVSGISGTGVVAEGVEFSDGTVVIRWVTGDHRSTVVWPNIAAVEAIHGHGGATRIVWDVE